MVEISTNLDTLLQQCEQHNLIEHPYVSVVKNTFTKLNEDGATEEQLKQLYEVFEATARRLINTEDTVKAASMFMARATSAPDLTIAHINLLLTTIATTFRRGNEILVYIARYNSCIVNLCREQIETMKIMSTIRNTEGTTDIDVAYVTQLIDSQFILL